MRYYTPEPRPYRLEILADDGVTWELWSTYVSEENAEDRRTKLHGKGYTGRVVLDGAALPQGEATPVCPMCDERHDGPYDGSCLL